MIEVALWSHYAVLWSKNAASSFTVWHFWWFQCQLWVICITKYVKLHWKTVY